MKKEDARRVFVTSLLLAGLLACQIPTVASLPFATLTSVPIASQTSPPTATQTATETLTPTPTLTETPSPTITPTFAPPVRRVVIVSVDGLRPDAILLAPMHNVISLMQSGAFTLGAQTVFPSVTLVAHSSMLVGTCPSKHGVDWNDYLPERGYAKGTDLFDIAHAAGLRTEMYYGKQKMIQITEPSSLDNSVFVHKYDSALMDRLIADFPQDFGILFVHLPETDEIGHEYGWLSPEQLSVIRGADEAIERLLAELDARSLRGETLIIITSDHGGHGQGHGSAAREDMSIPWVASGPGVQPKTLTTPVHTMDTAATAAFALGLNIPAEWDGVPVYEAFGLPVPQGKQSVQCQY